MEKRDFDGVICFGGVDWWYHNRGHYDLQMMREMSRRVPVLYVNSIGMRTPSLGEGGMFVTRVKRKWKSLRRGLVVPREGFGVFSPFALPGKLGRFSRPFVPGQIRRAARRLGIRRPLVWVACPPALHLVPALDPAGLVFQRTDRFEAFANIDPKFIGACVQGLLASADLTLYCSHLLMEEEQARPRAAAFVDHGVDYELFAEAGSAPRQGNDPADVEGIPNPRVGFVGGIDAHTFDPKLFERVAALMPEVSFVLVGGSSLPDDWCSLANVHRLGQRPYEEVARYMAASDVLIMPWNDSEWIQACNPVKLKEYLAVGRPIVTTPFHELFAYDGFLRIAKTPEEFVARLREALADPGDAQSRRERVRDQTWERKLEDALAALGELGLAPIEAT